MGKWLWEHLCSLHGLTARMKRNTCSLRDGTVLCCDLWTPASLVLKVRARGRDGDLWESADLQSLLLLPCDLGQVILLPRPRGLALFPQPSVFRMDSYENPKAASSGSQVLRAAACLLLGRRQLNGSGIPPKLRWQL